MLFRSAKDLFKPREEKAALPKAQDLFRPAGTQALPKAQDLFRPAGAQALPKAQDLFKPKTAEAPDEFPSLSEIGTHIWEHNIVSDVWHGTKRVYVEMRDPVAAAKKLQDTALDIAKAANETSFSDLIQGAKHLGEEIWTHPKRSAGVFEIGRAHV